MLNTLRLLRRLLPAVLLLAAPGVRAQPNPPIYIAFLWHMHQPIYWPGESVNQTINQNRYPFSVQQIFTDRTGPYTDWPKNAVQKGIAAGLPNFGAQVSLSGSLVQNLNDLATAGRFPANWKSHWLTARSQRTALNNPRLDLVGFGYHHPLMGLVGYDDIRRQIQAHKAIFQQNFPGAYSKGIFPPENAFATTEIPALVDEGLEWVLVDNAHFDRACQQYPWNAGGNVAEPNRADQANPNPNDWVQLNNVWAPTRNSARWGRQPHWVEHVDPATGQRKRIIAVPADRYLGNEDGRGGFGALNYDLVMSQLASYNTDPQHPILIVLHHDGDNYGGGTDSYYGNNFQSFVNWLQQNGTRFQCTTVQDYLDRFPPDTTDVIHVESGSWSGADNGDPEFKKWNADYTNCLSWDRNSWGVVTAAQNLVRTAEATNPTHAAVPQAWAALLNAQASDYWYWDGSTNGIWDAHPTRACNTAVTLARQALAGTTADPVPPSIWLPQREPYNPGANEWNQLQTSDFTVWTYAFDKSGLQRIQLKYRVDLDGQNPRTTTDNETYAGGPGVAGWQTQPMQRARILSATNPLPAVKAAEYSAQVRGLSNVLVDYYVEALDSAGNLSRSEIQHVWVGPRNVRVHNWPSCDLLGGTTGPGPCTGGQNVTWTPLNPTTNDTITITVVNPTTTANLHWGVNQWLRPDNAYWPANTSLWQTTGPAVETPFGGLTQCQIKLKVGPFNQAQQTVTQLDFVLHYDDNTWNNNNGQDWHLPLRAAPLGTGAETAVPGFALVPNPATGRVSVRYAVNATGTLTLRDLLGRVLFTSPLEPQTSNLEVDLRGLAAGVYVVEVEACKAVSRQRLVVR